MGVTNSDGSVSTESGIVSESGTSFTTITTFHHQPSASADITTEFTTTWEVTNSDGSVSTESGIVVNLVLPSPRSLRSHHQPHLVLLPMLLLNSQPHEVTNSDGSVSTESGIE